MRLRMTALLALLSFASCPCLARAGEGTEPVELTVTPSEVVLRRSTERQQVIVTGTVDDRRVDMTHQAVFRSEMPEVVNVDARGRIEPRHDGTGTIRASVGARYATVRVRVEGADGPVHVSFEHDVMPVLARAGCNSGACHGKASGQNGFKLSLLGFDPDSDYQAITRGAAAVGSNRATPSRACCLRRRPRRSLTAAGLGSTPAVPSTRSCGIGSPRACPATLPEPRSWWRISITPTERIMIPGEFQQVVVTARLLRRIDRRRDPPGRLPVERERRGRRRATMA